MSAAAALAKVFGSKNSKGETPSPQEAISKLRETEDMLNRKSEFLEKKIEEHAALAKKHGMKNKKVALNALRKKKRLEKQLQQIDGTISTVEFQREALENAHTNTEVLKNMGFAAKALKAAHQQLSVDDVYDLVDDVQEQNELASEITEVLSSPFVQQDFDEDDLLAELEKMEQTELDSQLLSIETRVPGLPEIPSFSPVKKTKRSLEDGDIKQLTDWAT